METSAACSSAGLEIHLEGPSDSQSLPQGAVFAAAAALRSPESIVRLRGAVVERLRHAMRIVREAEEMVAATGVFRTEGAQDGRGVFGVDALERALIRTVDTAGWRYLITASSLRGIIDAPIRAQWLRQVEADGGQALTLGTVAGMVQAACDSHRRFVQRCVVKCARELSWDYSRDQPIHFREQLILSRLLRRYGEGPTRHLHLNPRVTDALDGLIGVLQVMEGGHAQHEQPKTWQELSTALHERREEWVGDYFSIGWLLKGVGALRFHRPELIARVNSVLSNYSASRPRTSMLEGAAGRRVTGCKDAVRLGI